MNNRTTKTGLIMLTVFAMLISLFPAFAAAEVHTLSSVNPVLSGIEVAADNKTIYVYSDVDLKAAAIDKTKITLIANNKPVAQTSITVTILGTRTLRIVSKTALAGTVNSLKLDAGTVKSDATNENNAALSETALTISPKFAVKWKPVTAATNNSVVALELDTGTLVNPAIAKGNLFPTLKSAVRFAANGKTYTALGEQDTVSYDNQTKKLTVNFAQPLTGNASRIQLSAGALTLSVPDSNNKLLSPTLTSAAIDIAPYVVSTTLSPDNKLVTVRYNENIRNGSTSVDKTVQASFLKENVTLSNQTSANFAALGNTDTVTISKNVLLIRFTAELEGAENRIQIDTDAIKDGNNNFALPFVSDLIAADEAEPFVVDVGFKPSDKTLTVYFNENIFLNGSKTLAALASELRYNITDAFDAATVSISGNALIIRHKTTAITNTGNGGVNNIVLQAGSLRDAALNPALQVTTPAPDVTGPTVTNYSLSNNGKDLLIEFNENLFSVARTLPLSSISITYQNGPNTLTKPLSDAVWRDTATTLRIADGNTLRISNLRRALVLDNMLSIRSNSVRDRRGNRNLAASFTLFTSPGDSITMLDTADAALNEITNMLHRLRELSIVSQNQTTPDEERTAIQSEVNALLTQINTVATTTTFNAIPLIGDSPYTLKTAVGVPNNSPRTFAFSSATPAALGISSADVSTTVLAATTMSALDAALNALTKMRMSIYREIGLLPGPFTNLSDSLAVLNAADIGLGSINEMLQRIRELAVLSQDPTATIEDRTGMQTEVNALLSNINQVAEDTAVNSMRPISSSPVTLRTLFADQNNLIHLFTFTSATTSVLNINSLDISSAVDAAAAMAPIDTAISAIADARLKVGNQTSLLQGPFISPSDAIPVLQAAETGLSSLIELSQRIRELAVESQNPSVSESDRAAMQLEVNALIDGMNTIATTTGVDSIKPLGDSAVILKTLLTLPSRVLLPFHFKSATPTSLGVATLDISNNESAAATIVAIDSATGSLSTARTAVTDALFVLQ